MSETQLGFFDAPGRYERFKRFHRNNPAVYELFRDFARQMAAKRDHFGARIIWERIRWYTAVETTEGDYKLNDHYAPYYARLLSIEHPEEFGGVFEMRDTRFDTTIGQMRQDLLN